jgi:hypothetical protein
MRFIVVVVDIFLFFFLAPNQDGMDGKNIGKINQKTKA